MAQIPHAQNNVRKSHMHKFRYAYAFMKGAIMRVVYNLHTVFTVFTYEGVYTVFTYEGVLVYTVLTYEGVYTVFTYDGICACGICAYYFAHVGFAQMGFAPSCPTPLQFLKIGIGLVLNKANTMTHFYCKF